MVGRSGGKHGRLPTNEVSTAELNSIVFGQGLDLDDDLEEDLEPQQAEVPAPLASKKAKAVVRKDDDDDDDAPEQQSKPAKKRKAAWVDADDEELQVDLSAHMRTRKLRNSGSETVVAGDEYERRLRKQFQLLHGNVRWAEAQPDADEDDEDEDAEGEEMALEPITSALAVDKKSSRGGACPPQEVQADHYTTLDLDLGIEKGQKPVKKSVLQALQFHPSADLLLTGGLDCKLKIFSLDSGEASKVSSHHFTHFRIHGGSFTPTGEEVLLTGDEDQLAGLDVATGTPFKVRLLMDKRHSRLRRLKMGPNPEEVSGLRSSKLFSVLGDAGNIILCDVGMKQPVRTLRMPMAGVDSVFCPDKDRLLSIDNDSNIFEWDVGTGRCLQRVKEPWAVKPTCLAIGGKSQFAPRSLLAVGTHSGIVDLLDISGEKLPKAPVKGISNLTMPITSLCFHPQSEVLAAASIYERNHLRLIHTGTQTVFTNFPPRRAPFKRVVAVDFSKHNGLVAMGNKRGKVHIYQLQHYAT
mmetsp:Transcript_10363/g.23392  ORF Transcript_10363/g.23392 Transcript_10363/m.23392 type:complete len:523 (-) Transcript_10363:87-1655(-)